VTKFLVQRGRAFHVILRSVATKDLAAPTKGSRSFAPLRMTGFLLAAFLAAGFDFAQDRQVPFWPDEVPAAIRAQVDGVAALETVRELGRFHRVHGTPGFYAAAEHMKTKLLAAGLSDASIERLPADGKTRYAHFVSYYGWDPVSASLEEVSPRPGMI